MPTLLLPTLLLLAPLPGEDPLAGASLTATLVATGFGSYTEGPLWSDELGGLLFSELEAPTRGCTGRTLLLVPPAAVSVLRDPSCNANGLAWDRLGRRLAAEHGSRSITRALPGGGVETLASAYTGIPLNAPNDLAVRRDGTVYFTDPDFIGPTPPTLGFNGLYRLQPDTGELVLEAKMHSPNGIALSPDEATLYVTNLNLGNLEAFRVLPNGRLRERRVLVGDLSLPDGMTVDSDGNLFLSVELNGRGAIVVCAPDGSRWGRIELPEPARNCAFGGADRRTLYVTAGVSVYRVELMIPGLERGGGPRTRGPFRRAPELRER